MTMMEAIEALNLPKPEVKEKGQRGGASRKKEKSIVISPAHAIQVIDLSGFKVGRVSRSAIRELLDGIEQLPAIRSINLRDNGITDDYDKEILALFDVTKIRSIDLSKNCIKKLALQIGKKLRDEIFHIQWLDLTQNEFDTDVIAHAAIIQGLKK